MSHRKQTKIKNLKMRTTGLEKRKGKRGVVVDPKSMEVETFDTRGRFLVSQQLDLIASVMIAQ